MKITINQLRKVIRETIEEIATPGDYRYGNARGGVQAGGTSAARPQFMQPGVDNSEEDDLSSMAPQGVGGAGSQYIQQGVGGAGSQYVPQGTGGAGSQYVAGQSAGGSSMAPGSAVGNRGGANSQYIATIPSSVLKGKNGQISFFNGDVYSVDSASDGMSGSMSGLFNTWDKKSSSQLSREVISILMQNDVLEEMPISDEVLDEIGVQTTSGEVKKISDYFSDYNNGFIGRNESHRRRGRRL